MEVYEFFDEIIFSHNQRFQQTADRPPRLLIRTVMPKNRDGIAMPIIDLFQLLIKDYWENVQRRNSLSGLAEESNWYDALVHFKNYAYERNITGAITVYRDIAENVLDILKHRERWHADLELKIWENFKKECSRRKIKPNKQVDPLKPSKGNKKNLARFVWNLSTPENKTIAAWAFNMLKQNRIREAHQELKRVWGVGDKIASFYLRDIFWIGNNLNPGTEKFKENDIYLLQPIDIWVERAAKAIGIEKTSKTSIAKFICSFEKKIGLAPGGANIAFWMLGSNYVDYDEFEDVIAAITNKSEKVKRSAQFTADYFVSYYGRFGEILRDILA